MRKFFTSTSFLVNGILVIGLFVMFVLGWVLQKLFGSHIPETYLIGLTQDG